MKRNQREHVTTNNGVKIVAIDTDKQDILVEVYYNFDGKLSPKYDGVVHYAEHVVFNDIIEGYNSLGLIALAKESAVNVNAYTSQRFLSFIAMARSLKIDSITNPNHPLNMYDTTDESIAFILKYVQGVIKKHHVSESAVELERGIIESEKENDGPVDIAYHNYNRMMNFGYSVIGSRDGINSVNADAVNDVLLSLPIPTIMLTYNKDIQGHSEILNKLVQVIEMSGDLSPVNELKMVEPVENQPEFDLVHYEMNNREELINDVYVNGGNYTEGNSNALSVSIPIVSDYDKPKTLFLISMLVSYLFSTQYKNSITNYVREVKHATYSNDMFYLKSIKNPDADYVSACMLLHNSISMENKTKMDVFIKDLDTFITNIKRPSDSDLFNLVKEMLDLHVNVMKYGLSKGSTLNRFYADNHWTESDVEVFENFNVSIDPEEVKEFFEDNLNNITLTIF